MTEQQPATEDMELASRWRRALAFIVDYGLLATICLGISFLLPDLTGRLHDWGRLVGVVLFVGYFAALDSNHASGISLGKRLLGISVVHETGACLSPSKAAIRAAILVVPIAINGLYLNTGVTSLNMALTSVMAVALFGLGLSLFYLFLFNRNTRQSLHDLLTGALVVRQAAAGEAPPQLMPMWRGHWWVVSFLLLTAAVVPLIGYSFGTRLMGEGYADLQQLASAQQRITSHDAVIDAQVTDRWNNSGQRWLRINAVVLDLEEADQALARRLANDAREVIDRDQPRPVVLNFVRLWQFGLIHFNRYESTQIPAESSQ